MKKLLFLVFTLASISGFSQSPGLFKYLRIGTVTDSTTTVGTANGTIYYNPTSGKFRFREGGVWKSIGSGGGGGSGTVTTVSVVTANGFSGSVANATTTPAITLSFASPGSNTQLIYNNSGALGASANLLYNTSTNTFLAGTGVSITGSGTRSDNFYLGLNHTDAISGGGVNKWNFFLGEQNQISNASSTSNNNINDAFLLGSFYNKLSSLSTGVT